MQCFSAEPTKLISKLKMRSEDKIFHVVSIQKLMTTKIKLVELVLNVS